MTAIDWQKSFPFLLSQQPTLGELLEKYPRLTDFDLSQDWLLFEQQHPQFDIFKKLRIYRKTRLALIASLDDVGCGLSHLWAMHATTALATMMVQQAYRFCEQELKTKYGQVINTKGQPVGLQVFALGKLGTGELNYSSDLDLVFVYEQDGLSNGSRQLEAQPYFERFGRRLIQLLDQFTADGQVYRIDMRLRPFGSAAPIVCSNDALSQYIINEGRAWERFAWMRSHTIAGNPLSGAAMLQEIKPFIYRKHLDYSVFESLARIKREMSADLANHQANLKLGEGGIREIEFIVQSLQVTFGGRIERLQGRAIFPQFQQLKERRKMSAEHANALQDAWLFLRKLENLCQLQNDQQTHKLPEDAQDLQQFALLMGFDCWTDCHRQLEIHRRLVHRLFNDLFNQEQVAQPTLNSAQVVAIKHIIQQHFQTRIPQIHVDKVQQLLERAWVLSDDEQLCQQRLLPILKSMSKRPSYLLMLIQEQSLLPKLLKLLQKSEYFGTTISLYPALLELFFEPENIVTAVDRQWLQQQWTTHKKWDDLDAEQWAENIRFFKQKIMFKLIQAHLQQQLCEHGLRLSFCSLAEFLLFKVLPKTHRETLTKHPQSGIKTSHLQVIAYGSLGVKNMHQDSDLDIVFIVNLPQISSAQRHFLQRWIKRTINQLSTTMYHGSLYQIDLQLRPNGNSGAMVTTIDEFTRYQRQQAWLWEHAALIKARLLHSPTDNWFNDLRIELLCRPKTTSQITQAFEKIEQKMQQLGKSNHHQELKLLKKILQLTPQKPDLIQIEDYSELIEKAQREQLLNASEAKSLLAAKQHIR